MSIPAHAPIWHQATLDDIDTLHDIEVASHPLPWGRGHFVDVLTQPNLYLAQLLCLPAQMDIPPSHQMVLSTNTSSTSPPTAHTPALPAAGFFIGLHGFEEIHLLNLAVHPDWQRRGCAVLLLQQLRHWALWLQAQQIVLEVRASNQRAIDLYLRFGFIQIGQRRDYYPTLSGGREDALVMHLPLYLAHSATL